MTQSTGNLPEHAEHAIRDRVRREMAEIITYQLPLLDAYIALAAATLVVSCQLANTSLKATPSDTYPIAVDEVNRQSAKKLAQYFQDDTPEDHFYLLCLAKGYDDVIPLDPPWLDESAVLAPAAGLVKQQKGKHFLVRNPALDDCWANEKLDLPKTDFTPNWLEGTPV